MNINQIASGIVSSYLSKLVHLAASVAIVPFLLSSEVLGPENYGRAFSILGITSVLGIVCAGLHSSADRAIAQAIGNSTIGGGPTVGELMGSGTKVLTLVGLSVILPILLFAPYMLSFVGIPDDPQYRWTLQAAAAISLLDNALYLSRSPLLARGDLAFVNLIAVLEIVGRTAAIFVLFTVETASVAEFLGIQALSTLVRHVVLLLRLERSDLAGSLRAPLSSAMHVIRYAGPVSLAEGSIVAVRIFPVMIASRLLGPIEAGYVAIVVNTLQGYFLQIFFAVVQPMAVPIASRLALDGARSARRGGFFELESAYVLGVAIVFGMLIFWTPAAIPLWLGDEFAPLVFPTQLMLVGSGVQTSSIIRRSILIGQGIVAQGVPIMVGSAVLSLFLVVVGVVVFDSWIAVVVCSSGYLIASSLLGVDWVFARSFRADRVAGAISRLLSIGSMYAASVVVSWRCSPGSLRSSLAWSVVALVASLVLGFTTIISPKRAARLAKRIYRSRGVDLFG